MNMTQTKNHGWHGAVDEDHQGIRSITCDVFTKQCEKMGEVQLARGLFDHIFKLGLRGFST